MEKEALDLYSLRKSFMDGEVLICFNGPFSHSIIEEIGIAVKRYLETETASRSAVSDVFAVFVELAQNMQSYTHRLSGVRDEAGLDAGTLAIGRHGERYAVSAGNMVDESDVGGLSSRLEELRSLDKPGLKALYKERLRAPRSAEGGAGLGLIDVARRATQPLSWGFREIDERYRFFSLSVII
jgi:hypothetical protein